MLTKAITEKATALGKSRKSEIIAYLTTNKQPQQFFQTLIASDSLPYFGETLRKLGKKKKISLFIFSLGGFLEAPWPLVNLIREHCKEFEVIIPNLALSAATMISLGADSIVMTPRSLLSPVDPAGELQITEKVKKKIQIEDIMGFIDFSKNKLGIKSQNNSLETLKLLANEIPPSFLGSIYRTQQLIASLTDRILSMHNKQIKKEQKKTIVEKMTKDLFAHNHFINRREAKVDIGLGNIVTYASRAEEVLIDDLFSLYSRQFDLDKDFNAKEMLGERQDMDYELRRAVIDSSASSYSFLSKYNIKLLDGQYNVLNTYSGWKKTSSRR